MLLAALLWQRLAATQELHLVHRHAFIPLCCPRVEKVEANAELAPLSADPNDDMGPLTPRQCIIVKAIDRYRLHRGLRSEFGIKNEVSFAIKIDIEGEHAISGGELVHRTVTPCHAPLGG